MDVVDNYFSTNLGCICILHKYTFECGEQQDNYLQFLLRINFVKVYFIQMLQLHFAQRSLKEISH